MASDWNGNAEFIASAIDPRGIRLWLVELGAGRTVMASFLPGASRELERLAPGELVRIRFRSGNKTPEILGYSDVDRSAKSADDFA